MLDLRQKLPTLALLILSSLCQMALGESPAETSQFVWRNPAAASNPASLRLRPKHRGPSFEAPAQEFPAVEPENSSPVVSSSRPEQIRFPRKRRSNGIGDLSAGITAPPQKPQGSVQGDGVSPLFDPTSFSSFQETRAEHQLDNEIRAWQSALPVPVTFVSPISGDDSMTGNWQNVTANLPHEIVEERPDSTTLLREERPTLPTRQPPTRQPPVRQPPVRESSPPDMEESPSAEISSPPVMVQSRQRGPTPPQKKDDRSVQDDGITPLSMTFAMPNAVSSAMWLNADDAVPSPGLMPPDSLGSGYAGYAEVPPSPVPDPISTPAMIPVPEENFLNPTIALTQGYELHVANWSPLVRYVGIAPTNTGEPGIGHERVEFAPFEMDVTQPSNYWLIRVDSANGLQTPDRGGYFWTRPSTGAQNSVNYQDLRFVNEIGGSAFSVMTEMPLRAVQYNSTGGADGGLGDMKVATKIRMINGKQWQLTQIFRTYIPTGSLTKGLGAGHVSLEPGLLARYQVSPETYLHGEAKLWFPIAANPQVAGQVARYGIGVSHILYETDNFAALPTLEMVAFQYLGGHANLVDPATLISTNGDVAVNVIPGIRFVLGPPGDLGLFELGFSGIVGMGAHKYLDSMFRVDLKFIF